MNKKLVVLSAILVTLLAIVMTFSALALLEILEVKGQVNLYQKSPGDWKPIRHGGVFKYTEIGPEFRFFFQGWGLRPKTGYSLIFYHPDEWGAEIERFVIAQGTTDWGGRIWLQGTIPWAMLEWFFGGLGYPNAEFIKVWLVLSSDLTLCPPRLTNWNPTEWLFEASLITLYGPPLDYVD